MKNLWCLLVIGLFASGCANATRTHLDPGESHYEFTIGHQMGEYAAFLKVQQALAEMDIGSTSLSQSETGYLLLRPQVSYRVGGPLGEMEYAEYALRIHVTASKIILVFDLGSAKTHDAWIVYPPKTEMPLIRAKFSAIAASITTAVHGSQGSAPSPNRHQL